MQARILGRAFFIILYQHLPFQNLSNLLYTVCRVIEMSYLTPSLAGLIFAVMFQITHKGGSLKNLIFLTLAIMLSMVLAGCQIEKEVDFDSGETNVDLSAYFGTDKYIPDIETFMQIGYTTSPQVSPDGNNLFFTASMSGAVQLYRLNSNGWPYQLTFFPDGIDWYVLSKSGNLAVVGASIGGSENSQLILVDAHTGRARQLTDYPEARFSDVVWSQDDKYIYYSSNRENMRDFMLYRTNLETNEEEKFLETAGINQWAAISLDDQQLIYKHYISNVNTNVYLYDIATGDTLLVTPHEGDVDYQLVHFSADGSFLYLVTNDNPQGFHLRAKLDLESHEITYLADSSQWEVEYMAMTPDRRFMAWVINEEGYGRLKIADMVDGRELPVPDLNGIVGSPVFTDDGQLFFEFNNPKQTFDIWSWDWRRSRLKQMTTSAYAGVDPTQFAEPQLIKYPSFDGMEIPAFLYLPANYKGGPIPFILDIHGGPEGQFRPTFNRHFQYLMAHGFGLLAPNVRGSEGYGKDYMALDNYKNRLNSVKDMKGGADWLIEQGYTKQGMVGVKGGSYGGYMVMAGITEYPNFFSAALDNVGIVNFETFLENTAEYRRYVRESEYGPLTDREFLRSISPIHKANLIKTPLLVVHGANDPRVPVSEAYQIIDVIKKRGGAVEALIYEDEGHGASKRENILEYYRAMVDFFSKHLKEQ